MMTMSLEERLTRVEDILAIQHWMSTYCNLADKSRKDTSAIAEVVDMFTDDLTWVIGDLLTLTSKADAVAHLEKTNAPFPWFYHSVLNPLIEVNGDTAKVKFYFFVPFDLGDTDEREGNAGWLLGNYEGTMIKTADGWKANYWIENLDIAVDYHKGWHKEKYQFASMLGLDH